MIRLAESRRLLDDWWKTFDDRRSLVCRSSRYRQAPLRDERGIRPVLRRAVVAAKVAAVARSAAEIPLGGQTRFGNVRG